MEDDRIPLIVLLDDVRSLHNTGAVFRSADAFGIAEIWLCGITGKPPHRDLRKTALGAEDAVPWRYFPSRLGAVSALKERGAAMLVLEQTADSIPIESFSPVPGRWYGLWLGHEVYGVNTELIQQAEQVLEIPQYGSKRSLNVSVAAGVAMWSLSRKWRREE